MAGRKKRQHEKKLVFSTFPKLMAMSSYMVNSKYVDPKFPPCEEYLQSSYLGEQGADYYGASQGSDFQPHQGLYPRSNYGEQTFGCGNAAPGAAGPPRGHGQQEPPGPPPGHFPGPPEHCPPPPLPATRVCGQQHDSQLKNPNGAAAVAAAALKQPAVVYPWMKKVHVNSGKLRPGLLAASPSGHPRSPPPPPLPLPHPCNAFRLREMRGWKAR